MQVLSAETSVAVPKVALVHWDRHDGSPAHSPKQLW
jgi:hypothetical protein